MYTFFRSLYQLRIYFPMLKVYSISPCEYCLSSKSLVLTQVSLLYTTICYKRNIKGMLFCSLSETETHSKIFEIIIKLYFFYSLPIYL